MDIVEQSKHLMLALGAAPVLWLMIGLSLLSSAIIVERSLFFWKMRADFPTLVERLASHLSRGDVDAARAAFAGDPCAEAVVARAGLAVWSRGPRAVREALASALVLQKQVLEARLGVLGTLGNNAPFVGLLGTVIGIMLAFEELAHLGNSPAATAGVMGRIAEALVATAIGLCVAIPAVAAYNVFQRKVRGILGQGEALAHVLMVHLDPAVDAVRAPSRAERSHFAHVAEG